LAGLAAGFFADATAVADARRVERRFEPRITAEERRRMLATWRDAVERSKGWARAR
jgi:glycerol kinase